MLDLILQGFLHAMQIENVLAMVFGTLIGILFGALPGFTATMGVAVFIPFSFWMSPSAALLLISGVYCGAIYGGSISAVLIGIPGTPASVPTTFDGFVMTKRGEAGKALGLVTYASAVGGFLSALALLLGAPMLATFALKFGPPEQITLSLFGLSVVCMLTAENLLKGLIVGAVSLLLATVGQDPMEGYPRYTFGMIGLIGGLPLVPVLIGLFSLPEVFNILESELHKSEIPKIGSMRVGIWEALHYWKLTLKSSLIGIFIGIIPAAGPDIAAFISYNEAMRSSKNRNLFGKGNPEGLIASEAANNGVTGGSLIPLLTLSIPGSAPAAVFLGALFIHGLRPGPTLFTKNADIVYALLVGFALINILMYFLGIGFCKLAISVVKAPRYILVPLIITLTVVGSYAVQQTFFDVGVMFTAGLVGWIMQKNGFPPSPVALGLILGPLLEQGVDMSLVMFNNNLLKIFTRPLAVLFIIFTILSLAWPYFAKKLTPKMEIAHNGEEEGS